MRRVLTFIELAALVAALPAIALVATPPVHSALDARGIALIAASAVVLMVETLRRIP